MSSEDKLQEMKAKGPATSKGPVFLEHAKRVGYDTEKLCQVCEQGFHPMEECAKTLPGLYPQGKDWGKIVDELNEELEPPKHANYRDRQQEHHQAWDEEDREYDKKEHKKRQALIRRQSEEQTRREDEIDRAIRSRMGSVESGASAEGVPTGLLVEAPEKSTRRVRFAIGSPKQRGAKKSK